MASRAEHALGQHLALHAVFLLGQNLHVDVPVVHHDNVPVVNVVDQAVIVHVHRVVLLAFGSTDGEFHHVPRVQIQIGGHVAGADGGALGVHHDGDVGRRLAGHLADARDHGSDPFVGAMAHVQPEDVGAGGDEAGEHLGRVGGRTEGADNFSFAHGKGKTGWQGVARGTCRTVNSSLPTDSAGDFLEGHARSVCRTGKIHARARARGSLLFVAPSRVSRTGPDLEVAGQHPHRFGVRAPQLRRAQSA